MEYYTIGQIIFEDPTIQSIAAATRLSFRDSLNKKAILMPWILGLQDSTALEFEIQVAKGAEISLQKLSVWIQVQEEGAYLVYLNTSFKDEIPLQTCKIPAESSLLSISLELDGGIVIVGTVDILTEETAVRLAQELP